MVNPVLWRQDEYTTRHTQYHRHCESYSLKTQPVFKQAEIRKINSKNSSRCETAVFWERALLRAFPLWSCPCSTCPPTDPRVTELRTVFSSKQMVVSFDRHQSWFARQQICSTHLITDAGCHLIYPRTQRPYRRLRRRAAHQFLQQSIAAYASARVHQWSHNSFIPRIWYQPLSGSPRVELRIGW